MSYLSTAFSKNSIVMASDGRAHHFEDWKEGERVIGKIVDSYWDGHEKTFLTQNKIGISAQGVLFWGDERRLLSLLIREFEREIPEKASIPATAELLLTWFKKLKRTEGNEFEVMHFLISGFDAEGPSVFCVNTYGEGTVKNICPQMFSSGCVNGDGKAEEIVNPDASEEDLVRFAKAEIGRANFLRPFDVGKECDMLIFRKNATPFWAERQSKYLAHETYEEYRRASEDGKISVTALTPPLQIRYR